MPKKDYLKLNLDALDTWLTNFFELIDTIGVTLGLTAGQITEVKSRITDFRDKYQAQTQQEADYKASVEATKASKKVCISDSGGVRDVVGKMKKHDDYTEALGETLGIIGEEHVPDAVNAKPELKDKSEGGNIKLGFNLYEWDGINIYRDLDDGEGMVFTARDTDPPYYDTKPKLDPTKPEKRQYMAYFVDGDDQIGLPSDIITVIVP